MPDMPKEKAEKFNPAEGGDISAESRLKRMDAESLESMSRDDIDAIIAALRLLQQEALFNAYPSSREYISPSFFSIGGADLDENEEEFPSFVNFDSFAADKRNMQHDMEMVGRDMWLGVLQHARSQK